LVFLKEHNVSKIKMSVPASENVRGPSIKIALPVRPRLGGASPIFHLKMANDPVSKIMLFFEYKSKEKC
jgi:hypothetical protein